MQEALARVGLVAKGVSYALVGVLAIGVAVGHGGKATSRSGALNDLAQHGWGKAVLIALALGFAAYALWRLAQIADDDEWAKRIAYAARAAIYAGLTWTALHVAFGAHAQSQNSKTHHAAAEVLSWPGGTWIVGIAGLGVVGAGVWNGYRGVTRKFEDRWRHGCPDWLVPVAVVGFLARFVVFSLIGVFAIRAAIQYDPKDAIGLDGALQKLARAPYGPWLLGLTAAGLLAYGAFCLADARYRNV